MTRRPSFRSAAALSGFFALTMLVLFAGRARPLDAQDQGAANEFFDSHFHLTNYIQQGIDVRQVLQIMGTRVGRSTLFGIPLQQQWSYANSGDFAPTYYLHSDAPLYYAATSPRYARVHHDELADRVLDLMTQHPAWSLPLGYKDGVFGAERVPSGAYLGDRDMFLFLVDGNRDLGDPTDPSHAGLFRGFILRNSDVGAAAPTLDVFLFRAVCGTLHHLGLPARRRLPAPTRGCVDSGRVDNLARNRPRRPGRRRVTRSPRTPAGYVPGTRADAWRGH
jgi:hypothetical protein